MPHVPDLRTIKMAKHFNLVSLLTSSSTLICCALPATLVGLGSAATLASLVSTFPQLIWLSEHKAWLFGIAGLMLGLAGWLQWRARQAPCPIDPHLVKICTSVRTQAQFIYVTSLVIYAIGGFFAFVAPLWL